MADTDAKTRPNSIYESDFFTWTQEQAQLLRERRFEDLDLDNLVDEVASVGSSEKRGNPQPAESILTGTS